MRWHLALQLAAGTALLALALAGVLPAAEVLTGRDALALFVPLKAFLAAELGAGRLPAWYPFDGLGASVPGALVAGLLDPRNLLLLGLDAFAAVKWGVLLSYPLALGGAFALARARGLRRTPALLAGLAYAGSGYLFSMAGNLQYLGAASQLPWVLFAAERAARGSVRAGVGWGAAAASLLASGDPELLAAAGLASLALAAVRGRGLPQTRRAAAGLAGLAVLGLLTMPLLLPAMATFGGSSRAAPLAPSEALAWSFHPLRLLELVLGSACRFEDGSSAIAAALGGQHQSFWAPTVYLGSGVVALALHGLGPGAGRGRARLDACLGLLGLLLALGPWGGLYAHVPGLMHFRYPEKWMVWPTLSTALLAARGLQRLRGTTLPGRATAVAVALLATATALFQLVLHDYGPLLLRALLVLSVLWATARLAPRRRAWAALLLVAGELLSQTAPAVLHAPRDALGLDDRPLDLPAGARLCSSLATGLDLSAAPQPDGRALLRAMVAARLPDLNALAGLRAGTALLPTLPAGIDALCSVADPCADPCARLVGSRFDLVSIDEAPALLRSGSYRELRRLTLPRAVLLEDLQAAPEVELVPARPLGPLEPALQALHVGRLPTSGVALVGEESGIDASRFPGNGMAAVVRARAGLLQVETTSEAPAILVVREAFSTEWQGTLDGQRAKVVPVMLGMVGLPVPAGRHTAGLRFVPRGWPWAFGGTALGLALVLWAALSAGRSRRAARA